VLTPAQLRSLSAITDEATGRRFCGWCSRHKPIEGGKYFIRGKRATKTWCCAACRKMKEKSK